MTQYYQKQQALGSEVELSLVASLEESGVAALYRELWHIVFQFERQFSRFLPASELSAFNRKPGTKQLVSPAFHDILASAKAIGVETEGLYNPFILPALQSAGYDHSLVRGHEQDSQDDHSYKAVASVDRLEIGSDWARIPYNTALDLGGCGKGYLADILAEKIPSSVSGFWLSLGGDVITSGVNGSGGSWRIAVQDAHNADRNIGQVAVRPGDRMAAATSGTIVRKGIRAGKAWHHIIDPRTLCPADTDVLLVTVCDTSALRADVLASCAVILGEAEGLRFLRKHGVRAALFQPAVVGKKPSYFGRSISLNGWHKDAI